MQNKLGITYLIKIYFTDHLFGKSLFEKSSAVRAVMSIRCPSAVRPLSVRIVRLRPHCPSAVRPLSVQVVWIVRPLADGQRTPADGCGRTADGMSPLLFLSIGKKVVSVLIL